MIRRVMMDNVGLGGLEAVREIKETILKILSEGCLFLRNGGILLDRA